MFSGCRIILGIFAFGVVTVPLSQAQEYLPPVIDRSTSSEGRSAASVQGGAGRNLTLDERVARVERLLENQALVDMTMRLDNLQNDTQALRGEIESLIHTLESLKQRQRDLYLDIDRRLRQVELNGTTQPPVSSTNGNGTVQTVPTASAGLVTNTAEVAADPAQEREAYQKAFNALKDGQYDQAIAEFQTFLSRYPTGNYTDNAQYWLGEANYVTRRFKAAEKEFSKVLDKFPNSSKASDAMLKLGYTYYELGQWKEARKTLNDVVSRYGNSTVAKLAKNRLQKMRLEGR